MHKTAVDLNPGPIARRACGFHADLIVIHVADTETEER